MARPVRIIDGYITVGSNDTSVAVISQQEYDIIGNKTSRGVPNQIYYDNQLINGTLYVYNVPSDDDNTLTITTQRMFEDMTSSGNTFDFPQEWYKVWKGGLCAELAEE